MARANRRSRPARTKLRPDPPEVPPTWAPAPAVLDPGATWDGVLADAGVEVPEHVADVTLQECRWEGADLSGRTLTGLRCRDTAFVHCDLSGAVLDDAGLTRVSFTDCRLTGVVLAGASLIDVHVVDCRGDLANLRMARASHLLVEGTGLQGADLYRFTGTDCALLGCDLTGASFVDAELAGAALHGSTLDEVRGAFALRGTRIGADQQIPLGLALLGGLDIQVTEPPGR